MYFASSNCDTDNNPATPRPGPTMPAYDEAIVALDFNGYPAWRWRPREVDNDDLAFGGAPNAVAQPQNSFDCVSSCAWTSRPMTAS